MRREQRPGENYISFYQNKLPHGPGGVVVKFVCSASPALSPLVQILGVDLPTTYQAICCGRRTTYKVEEDGHGCWLRANLPPQQQKKYCLKHSTQEWTCYTAVNPCLSWVLMQKFCNPGAFLLFTYPCCNSNRTGFIIPPVNFTLLNTNLWSYSYNKLYNNYRHNLYSFYFLTDLGL